MNNDKVLSFLGLVKKAGKLEIGEESCGAAQRSGKARLILVAADAASGTAKRASNYAEWGKTPLITLRYTKDELGDMLGRRVCAVLAVTDRGFAAALAKKLADDEVTRT
ncbi:MAG: ribosomal L7Ae/L30e/S12e/Gadd45 family protein [Oscillospiraceae bacterium]|jgi:ribosomal protein L7Ae-like RNA K-turn-binding protein|nr:ribosomal L7Ae/L30e/S12e/Gadd45 family protein [Oscillospiraceae bacterium]